MKNAINTNNINTELNTVIANNDIDANTSVNVNADVNIDADNGDNDFVHVYEFMSDISMTALICHAYDMYKIKSTFVDDKQRQSVIKDLSNDFSFNNSVGNIDYAFTHIDFDETSKKYIVQWCVYALPNNNDATVTEARSFILNNLIGLYDKYMKDPIYSFEYEDGIVEKIYWNFGLNLIHIS